MEPTAVITIKDVFREVTKLSASMIRFESKVESVVRDTANADTKATEALTQITNMQVEFASFKGKWAVISAGIAAAVPIILKVLHIL